MTKDKAKAADPAAGQGKKITVKATNARGKEIAKSVNVNTEALISNIEQARKWVDLWEDAKRLKPYIEAILKDNPEEYSRLTFDDVLNLPASDDAIQLFQGLLTSAKKYEKLQQELAELKPFILEMLEEDPEKCEGLTLDDIYTLPATDDGIKLLRKIVKRARGRKGYRTIATAGNTQKITFNNLAIPTEPNYLNAMNLNESGTAYMKSITTDKLEFKNGWLYFTDERARAVSEAELKDLQTNEGIQNINIAFLAFFYTHLFRQWEEGIKEQAEGKAGQSDINKMATFYLPDLANARGLKGNIGTESAEAIKKEIRFFHNIAGFINEGQKQPSIYPVLILEGYDSKTNTVSISSPYLSHVVEKIYTAAVKRAKDGKAILRSDKMPELKPVNSWAIHKDIAKERNKAAVQNVVIIVQGVERCGENNYHISARTLIERNPILKQQLKNDTNTRRVLHNCFKKTWELLRTKTDLQEIYTDIVLPNPDDPANIPKPKNLDVVFEITHKGKKQT